MKEKRKTVLRYVIIAFVILAVVVVVLSQTLRRDGTSNATEVRSHVVGKQDLENRITGTGVFKPRSSVTVIAQVAAEVEAVFCEDGQKVVEGALLVQLNDESYRLAYEQAKSALLAAENGVRQSLVSLRAAYRSASNALEKGRRAFEKNEDLYGAKAISEEVYEQSREAYETAKVNYQSAKEQLNLRSGLPLDSEPVLTSERDEQIVSQSPEYIQAQLSLESAQNNLSRCRITAPTSGHVTSLAAAVGDYIRAFTPVLKIQSLDDMTAELEIDEVDVGKVRVGQAVEIESDSIIGEILGGEVVEVAPVIKTLGSTRTSTVLVDIREVPASVDLKAGASCTARIVTNVKEGSVVIPLSGFIEQSNTAYAYVMKPAETRGDREFYRLEKTEIKTGISSVNFIEITDGLSVGDRIVVGNLTLFRDGILVTLKEDS